jgi:divalent metal cation (Fe/Co/Zn/Cd) transporter
MISVEAAHGIADRLEQCLKQEVGNESTIVSHLEPTQEVSQTGYRQESASMLKDEIARISRSLPEVRSLHEVQIVARGGRYAVTLHCAIDGSATLVQAHEIATMIEKKIKIVDERIDQVDVHCEPQGS